MEKIAKRTGSIPTRILSIKEDDYEEPVVEKDDEIDEPASLQTLCFTARQGREQVDPVRLIQHIIDDIHKREEHNLQTIRES